MSPRQVDFVFSRASYISFLKKKNIINSACVGFSYACCMIVCIEVRLVADNLAEVTQAKIRLFARYIYQAHTHDRLKGCAAGFATFSPIRLRSVFAGFSTWAVVVVLRLHIYWALCDRIVYIYIYCAVSLTAPTSCFICIRKVREIPKYTHKHTHSAVNGIKYTNQLKRVANTSALSDCFNWSLTRRVSIIRLDLYWNTH